MTNGLPAGKAGQLPMANLKSGGKKKTRITSEIKLNTVAARNMTDLLSLFRLLFVRLNIESSGFTDRFRLCWRQWLYKSFHWDIVYRCLQGHKMVLIRHLHLRLVAVYFLRL